MLYRCCFPEGLPELHSSTPSFRRRAAVRLRHARLSTAVRLLGRLTLNLLTPHQYTCAGTRHSSKQLFPDFAEPWKLFPQRTPWRRQGKVLVRPLAEFHYRHGWWVESCSIFFFLWGFFFVSLLLVLATYKMSSSMFAPLSDGELYSGTAYNFLGSEPIISRYSPSQSLLRTEYSTSWLNGEFGQHAAALFTDL